MIRNLIIPATCGENAVKENNPNTERIVNSHGQVPMSQASVSLPFPTHACPEHHRYRDCVPFRQVEEQVDQGTHGNHSEQWRLLQSSYCMDISEEIITKIH